ncbi:hypothetical protein OG522_01090 [Streptomyces sp. NBC_01431]|nr:hypothetical protein [Streptomyces sp. NBC_01431]
MADEHGPQFLFESGAVAGAERASAPGGGADFAVAGLDFPAFVVKAGYVTGRVAYGVEEGGGQAVVVCEDFAVGAGESEPGLHDAHGQGAEGAQETAVGQHGVRARSSPNCHPDQEIGAGGVYFREEVVGVEAPVEQDQHAGGESVQQRAGQVSFIALAAVFADAGAQQAAGSGIHQRHHVERGVAGPAQTRADASQPGSVIGGVRHVQ